MRYFVFISDQKSCFVVFVPSWPAKWISFNNHRHRKVVGDKHNVLVHYVHVSAPNPSGYWCCPLQPFYMRYFVFISDQKSSCCFCAFHNSEMNLILQPHDQKSCKRQTQCSSTICGCLCTWPIWCCPLQPFYLRYFVVPFWSKIILLFVCLPKQWNEIHSATTGQKICRRQTQCSIILCTC